MKYQTLYNYLKYFLYIFIKKVYHINNRNGHKKLGEDLYMIGNKLKTLRLKNGYTQSDLAKMLNLTPKAISFYENNQREPNIETLKKIANIFDVTLDYLFGRTTISNKMDNDTIKLNVYELLFKNILMNSTKDVSLADYQLPNDEHMALKVNGDSMYPDYLPGDTIIIEITPYCESGEDCVVYVNGYDATLKTVIKNSDGTITLKPINPEYPPKTYNPKAEEIKILGKVKEIRRKR